MKKSTILLAIISLILVACGNKSETVTSDIDTSTIENNNADISKAEIQQPKTSPDTIVAVEHPRETVKAEEEVMSESQRKRNEFIDLLDKVCEGKATISNKTLSRYLNINCTNFEFYYDITVTRSFVSNAEKYRGVYILPGYLCADAENYYLYDPVDGRFYGFGCVIDTIADEIWYKSYFESHPHGKISKRIKDITWKYLKLKMKDQNIY